MSTTNKNFTVEGLVAKYRNFVNEHCPQIADECGPMPIDDDAEEQLLVMLYSRVAGENADKRILEALSKYGNDFYLAALTDEEITFLVNHFSEVSSSIFDFFSDESNGKKWNYGFERPSQRTIDFLEFDPRWWNYSKNHTSDELQIEMQKIDIQSGMTIFIANSGYCDIAMLFPGCTIKGFTHHRDNRMDKIVWALGQIRLYAAGIKSEIVPCREDIEDWQYMADVDFAIWGTSYHCSYIGVEQFFQHMKPNSKLLLFMDKDDAAGNTRYESKDLLCLRKRLVKEKCINTIISFEEFDNYIEINRHRICVFADKAKNDTVIVKNSCSEQEIELSSHMLDAEILWPSYYIALKPKDGIALSEIVSFHDLGRRWEKDIDRELIIERKNGDWILSENAKKMPVVAPVDMSTEYKDANLCEVQLKLAGDSIYNQWIGWLRKIEQPCILLFGKKEKFVIGYINQLPEEGIATLDSVVCLIPKKDIDVRYVAALLLTPEVKNQIMSICEGSVNDSSFPLIINKVIVPNHNDKERLAFLSETNYKALIGIKKEMQEEHDQYRKSVRMRKHALTQSLSSVKSMFNALNNYRNLHDGMISDSEQISRVKGTTVKEAFEFIDKNIRDMMPALEHIADVEYSFNKPEWIDPERFIEGYITKKGNGWLNFKPSVTWDKGNNQAKADLKDPSTGQLILKKGNAVDMLLFPKDALERVFNNIVSNAQAHGFADSTRKDYELRFSWHTDGIALIVEIENNGTAIPSERDTASLLEYGVSSALHQNGHNGIGCNEIDDIMRRYDGKVEIVSSPEKKFTVKYVLTFNRSNIVKFI